MSVSDYPKVNTPHTFTYLYTCTYMHPAHTHTHTVPVEPVSDPTHNDFSPFTPYAREKRIALLRQYPYPPTLSLSLSLLPLPLHLIVLVV